MQNPMQHVQLPMIVYALNPTRVKSFPWSTYFMDPSTHTDTPIGSLTDRHFPGFRGDVMGTCILTCCATDCLRHIMTLALAIHPDQLSLLGSCWLAV